MSDSNKNGQLLAGFGKADITPPAHESFEIYDPIFFRALHVRQGDRQVTFLAADLFLFDDACFDMMAADLAETDVDPAWILPGASHMGDRSDAVPVLRESAHGGIEGIRKRGALRPGGGGSGPNGPGRRCARPLWPSAQVRRSRACSTTAARTMFRAICGWSR